MRWIPFVNLLLVTLLVLTGVGIIFYINKDTPTTFAAPAVVTPQLPKSPFSVAGIEHISEGPFALNWVAPHMLLPNLKNEITYYGISERPDFDSKHPLFHLAIAGNDQIIAVDGSDPVYLSYQGVNAGYAYSPTKTQLWLEMKPERVGQKLEVSVQMLDEHGELVNKPASFQNFIVNATPLPKDKVAGWELGDFRVDSTLLIRQKARWVGGDRFLEAHGGDEFAFSKERERIDFMRGDDLYSCFVKSGDFLVWNEGRWKMTSQCDSTLGHPLLAVKKIDDKVISFDLWDAEGKAKTSLNLIRARDLGGMPDLDQEFRFVGAKTWAQFIVESGGERFVLKPHDWLVLTSDGWLKLDSSDKLDAYVGQKTVGPLLVLDKMSKQNGKQVLVGHLFNASRTEMQPVELNALANSSLANSLPFYLKPDGMDGD